MKGLQIKIGLLLAGTVLAAGIYAASQPAANDSSILEVALKYTKSSAGSAIPLTVPKGTQFTITQPSNPTTGYSWALGNKLNQSILKDNGEKYVAPTQSNPPLVGQGGKSVWSFTAVGPGTQTIVLNYRRPWEKDQPPVQVTKFTVVVK